MSGDPRLPELFAEVAALAGAARQARLASLAAEEPALAAELRELLEAASATGEPFTTPAIERLGLAEEPPPEPVPERIGPYPIVRQIGRGGMGRVFLARQRGEGYERDVAVKLLRPAGTSAAGTLARLRSEARILAGLTHPGIARLLDAGRLDDGSAYLVLELVDGVDLLTHASERRLDLAARLALFLAILDAVAYAHARLVVHRDLKPGNILVDVEGRPRLLDFGVSRLVEPDEEDATTTGTELRGHTPAYASPEQLRGERATVASDVYSLGVVLYELLSGRRPFGDETSAHRLERAVLEDEPQPPSSTQRRGRARRPRDGGGPEALAGVPLVGQLGRDLDAICLKALRKEPDRRYRSVEALAEDLRRALDGRPVEARRGGRAYRLGRLVRRHRLAFAAGGAVLLALAVGVGLALAQARRATRERDRAEAAAGEARREATKSERMVELLVRIMEAGNPDEHPGPFTGQQLLERGTAEIATSLADEPELKAELDSILGRLWSGLGEIDRAAALLEPAAVNLERTLGPQHPATAAAWSRLAAVRRQQGRLEEARTLYERAIEVETAVLGPGDEATLDSRHHLANVLKAQGDFEGARALLEDVGEVFRRSGRGESIAAAKALGDLGLVYQRLERWQEAEAAHLESLRLLQAQLGEETPQASIALVNLADLWSRRGETARAIDALEQVIANTERAFGPNPRGLSTPLNYLGYAHLDAGQLTEARAAFERSIAAAVRDHGPDHSVAAWPMRGLAFVALAADDLDGAEQAFERARELRARVYPGDHWEVAQSVEDLADIAERRHDLAAAVRYRREALRIWRAVGPPGHPSIARAAGRLGALLCGALATATEGAALLDEALAAESGLAGEEKAGLSADRDACRVAGG